MKIKTSNSKKSFIFIIVNLYFWKKYNLFLKHKLIDK